MIYFFILISIILILVSFFVGLYKGQKKYQEGYKIGKEEGYKEGIIQESTRINEKSESYRVGFGDGVLYSEASRVKTLEKLVGNPTAQLSSGDYFLNEGDINNLVRKTGKPTS